MSDQSDKHIDVRQVLNLFQHIQERGEVENGVHKWQGISADSGFDGYSVSLSYRSLELRIHFHNKYDLEYDNEDDLKHVLKIMREVEPD